MATRKPGTVAAINRQIDAINAKGRRGNPTASKSAKIKADVRRFAKEHGIAISPNAGESPLMGKGDWFKVFDSWLQAHDYFTGWKWKHADHGLPFPWDERKGNPARTATLVARKPAAKNPARKRQSLSKTEYEVQYSRDGSSWEKWTSVLYEDMATAIAKRTAAEFPKYHVRVIRRA